MMRRALGLVLSITMLAAAGAAQAQDRKPPYWASIAAGKAMMRTGPGKEYPATWLYSRADLPIRVVEVYKNWRKVQDPGGTTGWMQVSLLSSQRSALVIGTEPAPLHEKADATSPIRYFAEPGVVGRLADCAKDWCQLNVGGRKGYLRTDQFWGTNPGESF
jgi:SH3-like domain-containing protein